MLLYKVIDGAIATTPVVKETKCFYYINDFNFDWRSRIAKEDALTTIDQALHAKLNSALTSFGLRKHHFTMASDRLRQIRALIKNHEEKNNKKLQPGAYKCSLCNDTGEVPAPNGWAICSCQRR